jgi:peroxiredoxin
MRHQSLMLELGTTMPAFSLPDTGGRIYTQANFQDAQAIVVAFICNHCPFVLHILDEFVRFAADYAGRGLAVIAISSNDVASFPEDDVEHMAQMAAGKRFGFPYLYDATQQAAIDFRAVCTPDFFIFGPDRRLAYRGQFDGSRPQTVHDQGKPPNRIPVTGKDLRDAAESILANRPVSGVQIPSIGCSMKWKPGREPDWG